MRPVTIPAAAGVLAAAAGVAAAQLAAAASNPQAGPLVAVGGVVIDATPTPVKEFAVRTVGTHDKVLLIGGIVVLLAVLAAAVGVLGQRRRIAAVLGAGLFGAAGVAAALSRPAAGPVDVLPSALGALITGAALLLLLHAYAGRPVAAGTVAAGTVPAGTGPRSPGRRAFLGTAVLVAGATAATGGAATAVRRSRGGAVARSRDAVRLPVPADPAPPLPVGTGAGFITANADFYRVDTALTVPDIDVDGWRLRIHGMVGRATELTFDDLLSRPLMERDMTLNCVSNEVGGPYLGTARWLGVPLAPLLAEVGVAAGADQLVARSREGMTIGTPVETVFDGRDTMLCVAMNGEPLPPAHGFPVRMLTPGLYGYAGACKWLTELELTTFDAFDAYWVRRGWGRRGPVKTASRIDRPRAFARLPAGPVTVAGVAWAQGRGIRAVEVRVDDGPWARAQLLPVPSVDTWVQWRHTWAASAGAHTLTVRATDGAGRVQSAERVTPFPDGATGWHDTTVTIV